MAIKPLFMLIARILTFVFLLISLIVLATTEDFNQISAYRYTFSAIVIGLVYTFLQTALTIFHLISGHNICGDVLAHFEFYGDKVSSHLLATGATTGYGITSGAAATLLLIAFFFSAISSIFSSFNLHNKS
ncbi:PREDICTED: CASP-like protein 4D1 [Nicotiana attenuata]|uniref:CASP-like protein n=1 Tax=Nicotiana attenuata TaxID=49451 RepID=A0A314KNF3_NICAT|nr:PREDICTED: CASP-like protein 4D1 [Nicotiana attenuata]OIT30762.1 casp-like protein 4d1 [Nicotiana attenuata]